MEFLKIQSNNVVSKKNNAGLTLSLFHKKIREEKVSCIFFWYKTVGYAYFV